MSQKLPDLIAAMMSCWLLVFDWDVYRCPANVGISVRVVGCKAKNLYALSQQIVPFISCYCIAERRSMTAL